MENNPLVSVNILSFNRKDELRNTLTKVYEQDYKNVEVIVVDNASIDGSPEMVEVEFPKVKLFRMQKNIGIAGYNIGFSAANGEYILVLDDDSYPEQDTINKGLEPFYSNSNVGIVALKIFNKYLGEYESDIIKFNTYSFIGCGAIFKRKIVELLKGYNEDYFLYHNELDFSARCMQHGYAIVYNDASTIIHNFNINERGEIKSSILRSERRYYYFFISFTIFIIQNFQLKEALFVGLKWLINRSIISLFSFYWKSYWKAILILFKNFPRYIKKRNVLKTDVQANYLHLIAFIDREFFPGFKKPNIFKIKSYNRYQIYFKNLYAFILFNISRIFVIVRKYEPEGILFINTSGFGDILLSSVIFSNSQNIMSKKIYFLMKKEHEILFEDYSGNIKLLFIDYNKYRRNLFYQIHYLNKLNRKKFAVVINLNKNRRIVDDNISINSNGDKIIALERGDVKFVRLFKSYFEKKYDKIICPSDTSEESKYKLLLEDLTDGKYIDQKQIFIDEDKRLYQLVKKTNYDFYKNEKRYIVINPFSSATIRNWSIEKFLALVESIISEYQLVIFLIGNNLQSYKLKQIENTNPKYIRNLAGELNLLDTMLLLKKSKLFIGVDSGMAHAAKIFNTPRILILGGGPYGLYFKKNEYNNINIKQKVLFNKLECFGCNWHCKFPEAYCLTKISVNSVFNEVNNLLNEHK